MASWPLARAEAVARAFTVYFHLANLAEEHQRIRTLRERDTGAEPVRESLAAAMATLGDMIGADERAALLGRLEVHPVLDRAPDRGQAPGRDRGAAPDQRAAGQPGRPAGWAQRRTPRHGAGSREEIDLLWRTSRAAQPGDAAAG